METMTHTPLNVDLKKMDYETFKTFMRELVRCIQSLKMRNKETNRDLAEFFGNKWDGYR